MSIDDMSSEEIAHYLRTKRHKAFVMLGVEDILRAAESRIAEEKAIKVLSQLNRQDVFINWRIVNQTIKMN